MMSVPRRKKRLIIVDFLADVMFYLFICGVTIALAAAGAFWFIHTSAGTSPACPPRHPTSRRAGVNPLVTFRRLERTPPQP